MGPRPGIAPEAPHRRPADAGRLRADELGAVLASAHPSDALPRVRRRHVAVGQRAAAVVTLLYVLTVTVLWLATPTTAGRGAGPTTTAHAASVPPGPPRAPVTAAR